jgi:hypothetical protein
MWLFSLVWGLSGLYAPRQVNPMQWGWGGGGAHHLRTSVLAGLHWTVLRAVWLTVGLWVLSQRTHEPWAWVVL